VSTTYGPDEPSEPSSDSGDYPPPDWWTQPPQELSGRPTGTPFQEQVMDAVTGSEFVDSTQFGLPLRRRGEALHISYDQALEYLGMNGEN
jgi:hypothetical protein